MLAPVLATALTVLLFIYLFMPSLWLAILAVDESFDVHQSGLTAVAARNPFRESGPPANMAKLILLRHKIQTSNRKRRSASQTRQTSRSYSIPIRPKPSWIRFRRPFGGKQHF
ncbi:hypothetical protein IW262DRAFT_1342285 [Armillaria fumosa]|nr:hypothetical protein IW262DRAFT_1342285 [Armillaria fumosa]